ncbi:MAG: NAD(P)-dependent dehydrogenase (short-subunit alcohol dehydrogenase family) [Acidimicrobiales bacterium]|jgi:NAD(P)-dependent dehydrogenase (short-subunit alcohol dehydrogenase family)
MELNDKVAIITGAGSGIGRALAVGFAAAGAKAVVCTDLNGANAAETADLVGDVGSSAELDVGDERAIEKIVVQTEAAHGAVDIFVSNAGYGLRGGLDLPTDEWERMMNVHTWSHLAAARAVVPGMVERGGGYILNTASAAGLLTQMDSGPYAVSKHAAVAFAEWLLINHGDDGIGVSVLCPQAVRTNILGPAALKKGSSNTRQAAGDGILEPEFVADACIEAIRDERFLVLPHPEVLTYFQRKADDYDRWLGGMRRFRRRIRGAR